MRDMVVEPAKTAPFGVALNTCGKCASRSNARRRPRFATIEHRSPSSRVVPLPCATTQAPEGTVHRYYDPTTGQFLTVDPLVSVTGQPFSYANDDPVNGSDPSGLAKGGPQKKTDTGLQNETDAQIEQAYKDLCGAGKLTPEQKVLKQRLKTELKARGLAGSSGGGGGPINNPSSSASPSTWALLGAAGLGLVAVGACVFGQVEICVPAGAGAAGLAGGT
jgi:hypothetical protein